MEHQGQRKVECGFTLIEMLIAITVSSVILLALQGATNLQIRVIGDPGLSNQEQERWFDLDILLNSLLTSLHPATETTPGDAAIAGDGTELSAIAVAPPGSGIGHPITVKLEVTESQDLLVFTQDGGGQVMSRRVSLRLASTKCRFSYLEGNTKTDTRRWLDEWTSDSELPALVRFCCNDLRHHAPIIVSPGFAVRLPSGAASSTQE